MKAAGVFQPYSPPRRIISPKSGEPIKLLGHADEIDILGEAREEVRHFCAELLEAASQIGLKINEGKTEYLVMTRDPQDEDPLEIGNVRFDGRRLRLTMIPTTRSMRGSRVETVAFKPLAISSATSPCFAVPNELFTTSFYAPLFCTVVRPGP